MTSERKSKKERKREKGRTERENKGRTEREKHQQREREREREINKERERDQQREREDERGGLWQKMGEQRYERAKNFGVDKKWSTHFEQQKTSLAIGYTVS